MSIYGKMIPIGKLFSNEIDIDTIPRSKLPDNTMAIKLSATHGTIETRKSNTTQCDNYYKDEEGWGTRIEPRLNKWKTI